MLTQQANEVTRENRHNIVGTGNAWSYLGTHELSQHGFNWLYFMVQRGKIIVSSGAITNKTIPTLHLSTWDTTKIQTKQIVEINSSLILRKYKQTWKPLQCCNSNYIQCMQVDLWKIKNFIWIISLLNIIFDSWFFTHKQAFKMGQLQCFD